VATCDNAEIAARLCLCWNSHDALVAALEEIAKGEGAYNRDPLQHAMNCIDNMKSIAALALAEKEASK
jgi:hypothetical protein